MNIANQYTVSFTDCGRDDIAVVGGKNASLGEMVSSLTEQGVVVPPGFATTINAYWMFIDHNHLRDLIAIAQVRYNDGSVSLDETGSTIRKAILHGHWPSVIAESISEQYKKLCSGDDDADMAVRSSATAEDLPNASFAGQQESYLNIRGTEALLDACKNCYASLFTDRAISYRRAKGFDHLKIALSVGVQRMVRSDKGASGVMFSIDTETGFDKSILINAAWGLGETVVKGIVNPDEYVVFKPLVGKGDAAPIVNRVLGKKSCKMIYGDKEQATRTVDTSVEEQNRFVLTEDEIIQLAKWAVIIESHYGCPMDIEWAKDGVSQSLSIVQARPETVQSQDSSMDFVTSKIIRAGRKLIRGISIGDRVVSGPVCRIDNPVDRDQFVPGSILVTSNTDPDWVPIMKQAKGVITDHGGRTSHAAIVSRELGLPAIVGTNNATEVLQSDQVVTLSCAQGSVGEVYDGVADVEESEFRLANVPPTDTHVYLNLANPDAAFRWWRLPIDGIGLARMEFVINNDIKAHPMALAHFDQLNNEETKSTIKSLIKGYDSPTDYFIDKLSMGLGRIASIAYPKPTIVRLSDFKSNEYADLIGGKQFEPIESNPMIGFRGASRYYSEQYADGFSLECQALKRLRGEMGFDNVIIMVPFCRTLQEADAVLEVLAKQGLKRGQAGLEIYMMCEVPSNVILAKAFAERFDGFSIGSNDLTQLTLGVDRDSEALSLVFDERDEAVTWMIDKAIVAAKKANIPIGLCGQAPSDIPEFAEFLVEHGIDSISVSPDSFAKVKRSIANAEQRIQSETKQEAV